MPFVNLAKLLLETYNLWDFDYTYFEIFPIDNEYIVFLFACHYGHTDVRVKISIFDLLKDL